MEVENIDLVRLHVSKVSLRTMSRGGQMISGRILRLGILTDLRAAVLNNGQLYPLLSSFHHPCKGICGNVWSDFWLSQLGWESCWWVVGRGQAAAKHPTKKRTASPNPHSPQ